MPASSAVRAFRAGQSEGHRILQVRLLQRGPDFGIAFGRTKSHDDVFGMEDGFQPRTKENGEIERGKRAFADDYGMNEFHRDVLRIGGVGSAPEGQQTAAAQKAFGHFAAGFRQARGFAREEAARTADCVRAAALRPGSRVYMPLA